MSTQPRVVAVLVTWNRRDLLTQSLTAVLAQSRPPDRVVVVDNASTDGTAALLADDFAHVEVVRSRTNLGGAGGFALGIRVAVADCDTSLLWVMDDDTVPEPDALAALVEAWSSYGDPPPALVASRVAWTDGRDHPMNTPRRRPVVHRREGRAAARVGCAPIRSASFVSVLLDAAVVRARGLPVADYFLWNDDFEFTTRLIRGNVGLLCPASVVVHHTTTFGSTDVEPGQRFFFEVRNKLWLFTRSSSLSAPEKLVYAGTTAVRWTRTVAASTDRRTLLRCLGRGIVAAVRAAPHPTDDVLAAAAGPSEAQDGR